MDEIATVTIQHIDLEPDQAQSGQDIYNFSVTIRGITNDPQATAKTDWNPVAWCKVTRVYPVDFRNPSPWFMGPINFAGAPISLNAATNGSFSRKLDFTFSKVELFSTHFNGCRPAGATHVKLQVQNLSLRPRNRDVQVERQVAVYVKNSNKVNSDTINAFM